MAHTDPSLNIAWPIQTNSVQRGWPVQTTSMHKGWPIHTNSVHRGGPIQISQCTGSGPYRPPQCTEGGPYRSLSAQEVALTDPSVPRVLPIQTSPSVHIWPRLGWAACNWRPILLKLTSNTLSRRSASSIINACIRQLSLTDTDRGRFGHSVCPVIWRGPYKVTQSIIG